MRFPWWAWALLAPVLFVSYQTLAKNLIPKGTSIYLVNAYASLIGAAVMLGMHLTLSPSRSLALTGRALPVSLGIGALIALGNFAIIKVFALGGPQSGFTLLYNPAFVVLGVGAGVVVSHERPNLAQCVCVAVVVLGLVGFGYFRSPSS